MKRTLSLILAILILTAPALAAAPSVDLSTMSYDELVELNQAVDREIMTRPEWKSITVPGGTFTAGVDLPAGRYIISPAKSDIMMFTVYVKEKPSQIMGTGYWMGSAYGTNETVVTLEDGYILDCTNGSVVITRYAGLFN